MKRMLGLTLAVTIVGAFAAASQARTAHHPPRHGALHAAKECSQYNGQAGAFCTITSSNLPAIRAGSRVFYLEAAGASVLNSDLVLYAGPGNAALGHVTLSLTTFTGQITLAGGTGRFQGFHAHVLVTFDPATNLWHWNGTYRFSPSDDNEEGSG